MTGDQLAALPLLLLAVYRLTLLATADTITKTPREWLIRRATGEAGHALLLWFSRPEWGARKVVPFAEATPEFIDRRSTNGALVGGECSCGEWSQRNPNGKQAVEAGWLAHRRASTNYEAKLAVLLGCPWCASFWLAIPAAVSWWHFAGRAWWLVAAAVLVGSAVAGLLAHLASPSD